MATQIFPFGTPLTVVWHFTKPDGTDFSIDGYTYRAYYRTGNKETEAVSSHLTASGNTLSIVIPATEPASPGEYSTRLVLFQNGVLFCTLKYNNAFVLSNQLAEGTAVENQEQAGNVVHLYTAAEYYLFSPVIPTVGDDGYWYVNGIKVTDGSGEYIPSTHTVEYDPETHYIIIDKGRVDSEGHSIQQTITILAEDHETASTDHALAENDHTTAAGDHTTATEDHTIVRDLIENYVPIVINGDVTNAPDEEDLTMENELLKFKNRGTTYGRGYKILRRNKTFAEQVTAENTIYEVRYNFDFDGDTVTMPTGCVLKFNGGRLENGTLEGDNTEIDAGNVQCFSTLLLSGSFCDEINAVWFGIQEGGSNAAANATIFNTYICPSMTEIASELPTLPFTTTIGLTLKLAGLSDVYFSSPVVFDGTYNVRLESPLVYTGPTSSTAITFGDADERISYRKFYLFSLFQSDRESWYNDGDIIDNVGLLLINISRCDIVFEQVCHFATCVRILGDDNPASSNEIKFLTLGGFSYRGLHLVSTGTGWTNENLFMCGYVANMTDNPAHDSAIAIELEALGSETMTANCFLKPCVEGAYIGVKCTKAHSNIFYSTRLEKVLNPLVEVNAMYPNIMISSIESSHTFTGTLGSDRNHVIRITDLLDTTFPNRKEYHYISKSDRYGAWFNTSGIMRLGSSLGFGGLFKIKADAAFCCKLPSTGRIVLLAFDNDNNFVPFSGGIDTYLSIKNGLYMYENDAQTIKYIRSGGDTDRQTFVVKSSAVSKLLIGVLSTSPGSEQRLTVLYDNNSYPDESAVYTDNAVEILGKYVSKTSDFSNDTEAGRKYVLSGTLDLTSLGFNFYGTGKRLYVEGGSIVNTSGSSRTVTITGLLIYPSYNSLLDAVAVNNNIVLSGMPASGTLYVQNGISTWSNGTNWVNEDGVVIDSAVTSVKGDTTTRTSLSLSGTHAGLKYYDTTLKKYVLWNGTAWTNLDGSALS